ncbi:hypothetical protein NEOLEDRAFT_1080401 [Neolentinus lepideus HHB14362 ss-1]|uniref:Uncharacterized protein n=1 Tax=Neolentinus lepideus HHB14362 ss-1 TaxID=1314782 RepID=A0A165MJ24_9AGAM|nr:hypothetical protein NEOLEDRAFT_1080401 [Neolentinus lepideus HHB14362 ss-1]
MEIEDDIHLETETGLVTWNLQGAIYYGDSHFTARFWENGDTCWFHDGMTTQQRCVNEGHVQPSMRITAGSRRVHLCIYIREHD